MDVPCAALIKRLHPALLCAVLLGATLTAHAEPQCTERYPTPAALASMFDVALATTDALDALEGVDVVLIARGGQDLSKYGLRHSHLAFLLREDDGQWRAVHLLNPCKTAESHLFREGVATFIGETSSHTDLRIGVPTPALRDALKAMLTQPAIQAKALHEARYSVVAYPFRTEYQNSNQWVLEVLGAAMAQVEERTLIVNRTQAQQWLQRHMYTPSTLHIGVAKRLGARFFVPNAAVTDHPASERISGNYSVVTVESIFDFLQLRSSLQQELAVPHVPVKGITAPKP
ncbi:DUF2145 domain-containing protein [Stenotrophomonas sp. TWI273]|jgi:hypothetical protein|uniref:DUF2145 domain-containing protein n=1 Tax=unclassified Stenotrophomonas TaxID=196198 RepID=UPI000E7EE128|nr:DUF2145 domain-containing protein [Stenotrophomonas sp.]HAU79216.1 DUF2145 domain-containing protein [Stenotrophomonas sp.]